MIATLHDDAVQGLHLHDIPWATYETILRDLEGQHYRITFDRGDLEIMTISHEHEYYGELLGRLIHMLTLVLNIPIHSGGSTTFRRAMSEKGLEPDKCFWIQNELGMRGKRTFDIDVDPPPDLALEVEISRSALDRMGIYAALRVPEVWCSDGESLRVFHLGKNGKYRKKDRSLAFPTLPVQELMRFLHASETTDETTLMRSFSEWVAATLMPKK